MFVLLIAYKSFHHSGDALGRRRGRIRQRSDCKARSHISTIISSSIIISVVVIIIMISSTSS